MLLFKTKLWWAMKSGYCTLWNERDHWVGETEPPPTTPKSSLHPEKMMLYMWWDWKGVLYYELLQENQTVNSNKYFSRLGQLKAALGEMCWNYSIENGLSFIRVM